MVFCGYLWVLYFVEYQCVINLTSNFEHVWIRLNKGTCVPVVFPNLDIDLTCFFTKSPFLLPIRNYYFGSIKYVSCEKFPLFVWKLEYLLYLCSRFNIVMWSKADLPLGINPLTYVQPPHLLHPKLDSSLGNKWPRIHNDSLRCNGCLIATNLKN